MVPLYEFHRRDRQVLRVELEARGLTGLNPVDGEGGHGERRDQG